MKDVPKSVTAALVLILLNAAFWLLFAVLAAMGALPSVLSRGPIRWVMAILALGTCVALATLVFHLRRRRRSAFYTALGFLTLVGVLSITDEVGLPDLATLAVSLAAVILLLKNRAWYVNPDTQQRED